MSKAIVIQGEVSSMDIVRNNAALLSAIKAAYDGYDPKTSMVTTSTMLRPEQYELVKTLSEANRLSQGDIFRAIIDEWCEMKLGGAV